MDTDEEQLPNIYLFGDSLSDPGNFPYEPTEDNTKSYNLDLQLGTETIQLRFNGKGRNSDGKTWPYFLAHELGYRYLKGSKIDRISRDADEPIFVNFALAGASQTTNVSVLLFGEHADIPYYGSIKKQIETFSSLIDQNNDETITRITADDLFFLVIAPNELVIISLLIASGQIKSNIAEFIRLSVTEYVRNVKASIENLYQLGMRRLHLSHYYDPAYIPLLQKCERLGSGFERIGIMAISKALRIALDTFLGVSANRLWPDLEITVTHISDIYNSIIDHAQEHRLVKPIFGLYPDFNTIAGTGKWPTQFQFPIQDDKYNSDDDNMDLHYWFCDDMHPSEYAHRLIASCYKEYIE